MLNRIYRVIPIMLKTDIWDKCIKSTSDCYDNYWLNIEDYESIIRFETEEMKEAKDHLLLNNIDFIVLQKDVH